MNTKQQPKIIAVEKILEQLGITKRSEGMTEYICQTTDNRNLSYIDDEPESVERRATIAGYKVQRIITAEQWERELYGPEYQAEVFAKEQQEVLNEELTKSIEGGEAA